MSSGKVLAGFTLFIAPITGTSSVLILQDKEGDQGSATATQEEGTPSLSTTEVSEAKDALATETDKQKTGSAYDNKDQTTQTPAQTEETINNADLQVVTPQESNNEENREGSEPEASTSPKTDASTVTPEKISTQASETIIDPDVENAQLEIVSEEEDDNKSASRLATTEELKEECQPRTIVGKYFRSAICTEGSAANRLAKGVRSFLG